jgi:hypothetical protein
MASLEWPGDLNAIPTANATAIGTIQTLVNGALAPAGIIARVGAFRFAPLETVKRVDLIASIDTSGREMFNALVAVWPASGSYRYAILPSDAHGVLARDVVDLDGAGVHKIVAGTFPGGYQGVDTIPIPWYGVYTLKQGKWIEVSDRYPELYQAELVPRLSLLVHVAEAGFAGDKAALELYRDCGLFIRFKYERMVMHNTGAGLERALSWADSSAPSIQVLAVKTLGEITDPRSISALRRLAGSQDVRVRIFAEAALVHIGAAVDRQ